MTQKKFYETLMLLGGKKKGKYSFSFLKHNLYIKHIESGIKYTIDKLVVKKDDKKPYIYAYRYYPSSRENQNVKKFYIEICEKDFKKYEPV